MEEYKDCFVAFIDILGFKEIIRNNSCDDIKNIFNSILDFEPHPLVKRPELYNKVGIYVMSDSIICYIESRYEDAFIALVDVCKQIQIRLANNVPPILVRGGIAYGPLYHKGKIVFGQGLNKAYNLESTLAVYPRIIFTEETRKIALSKMGKLYVLDYNSMFYKLEEDRIYYIDYLNTFSYIPSLGELSHEIIDNFNIEFYKRLYDYEIGQLETLTDNSIRQKHLWLLKKIEEQIQLMPKVKEYFDAENGKLQEQKDNRFSEALNGSKR